MARSPERDTIHLFDRFVRSNERRLSSPQSLPHLNPSIQSARAALETTADLRKPAADPN
jgi:hypothetical protein